MDVGVIVKIWLLLGKNRLKHIIEVTLPLSSIPLWVPLRFSSTFHSHSRSIPTLHSHLRSLSTHSSFRSPS